LDKADPHGAPAILALISPLVGIIFLTVSSQIWRFGGSHYQIPVTKQPPTALTLVLTGTD
jgi:hypothetical protein